VLHNDLVEVFESTVNTY